MYSRSKCDVVLGKPFVVAYLGGFPVHALPGAKTASPRRAYKLLAGNSVRLQITIKIDWKTNCAWGISYQEG